MKRKPGKIGKPKRKAAPAAQVYQKTAESAPWLMGGGSEIVVYRGIGGGWYTPQEVKAARYNKQGHMIDSPMWDCNPYTWRTLYNRYQNGGDIPSWAAWEILGNE